MKEICCIIPMFGKGEYTRKCVDTIKENAGMDEYDILVVDDGSPEPYKDDRVIVLPLKENLGYTGATNQGILWATSMYKYLHLMNNDTEAYPRFLKHLYDILEKDEEIAIASSVRFYKQDDGILVELYGIDLLRGFQAVTRLEHLEGKIVECNWVPLCSALVRTSIFKELGLLDKHMRTHSSDLDFCLRVKMAGYKIAVVTDSRVLHHHEITTKEHGITPEKDQKALLEKLAGIGYAQFMNKIPLDTEQKLYGKLEFSVFNKN